MFERLSSFALCLLVSLFVLTTPATAGDEAWSGFDKRREAQPKIAVCHCPPGNPDNCHTIVIGALAVDAHLAHGDTIGPCANGDPGGGEPAGQETACCPAGLLQCMDDVDPADCQLMGGAPFGMCAACADVACPPPACVNARGGCTTPHDSPGCDNLDCCTQICEQVPSCCTDEWTQECADLQCMATTDQVDCCFPLGFCAEDVSSSFCEGLGGTVSQGCEGDHNNDNVDDACACSKALDLEVGGRAVYAPAPEAQADSQPVLLRAAPEKGKKKRQR